jgi:L-asparagine transporter-like permease
MLLIRCYQFILTRSKAIYITAELSAPARQLPLAINTAIPIIIAGFIAVNTAYYILLPWDVVSTTDSVAVVCIHNDRRRKASNANT